jgi:hypothetical protein
LYTSFTTHSSGIRCKWPNQLHLCATQTYTEYFYPFLVAGLGRKASAKSANTRIIHRLTEKETIVVVLLGVFIYNNLF